MTQDITARITFVLQKPDAAAFTQAKDLIHENGKFVILSPDKAASIDIKGVSQDQHRPLQDDLTKKLAVKGLAVDLAVRPSEEGRKKLLICDMDSTLIGQECIDELADFAGVKDRVSAITERAMRGEIGFEGALTERVALLEGLPVSILEKCFEERIFLNPGARTLAMTMARHGARTVIVSGGFTYFSDKVASAAGFDHHQANILLEDGETLAGKVEMPILGREAKQSALSHHSADIGGPSEAVAIGDGANDLAMIQSAGLGIAYYAKPAVAAAAHCAINHTDLTTALYFQGYTDAEFVRT